MPSQRFGSTTRELFSSKELDLSKYCDYLRRMLILYKVIINACASSINIANIFYSCRIILYICKLSFRVTFTWSTNWQANVFLTLVDNMCRSKFGEFVEWNSLYLFEISGLLLRGTATTLLKILFCLVFEDLSTVVSTENCVLNIPHFLFDFQKAMRNPVAEAHMHC